MIHPLAQGKKRIMVDPLSILDEMEYPSLPYHGGCIALTRAKTITRMEFPDGGILQRMAGINWKLPQQKM